MMVWVHVSSMAGVKPAIKAASRLYESTAPSSGMRRAR